MATLHHPNLCAVYDVGEIDGVHDLTMAYVAGRSLADVLRQEPGQTDGQIAREPSSREQRVSVTELAEKVGITMANISVLKNGKAKAIRLSTLEAICKALQCQPGDILEYSS